MASSAQPVPKFAYVGSYTTKERNARGEGINVYRIDPKTGTWTHVQLVKDLVNPSWLTLDRRQHMLYSAHGDGEVVTAFRIDEQTGQLSPLGTQATKGKNGVRLGVDGSNKFVVVANYSSGTWDWFGPSDVPEYQLDLSGNYNRYVSALGNLYSMVICSGGDGVTHHQSVTARTDDRNPHRTPTWRGRRTATGEITAFMTTASWREGKARPEQPGDPLAGYMGLWC